MAAYTRCEVDSFDVERAGGAVSFASSSSTGKRNFGLKHVAAALLGGGAVLAGTYGAAASLATTLQPREETPAVSRDGAVSARVLLESPDVHRVVADNVLNLASTGPKKLGHSREEVHEMVASTFNKLAPLLKEYDPEVLGALEDTKISKEQYKAVVHLMAYLSDPRVMKLGLEAGKAMREAKSEDPAVLRKAVLEKLSARGSQLQDLHSEAVDKSLFDIADKAGEGFKSMLTPKKAALLKSFGDDWYEKFEKLRLLDEKILHDVKHEREHEHVEGEKKTTVVARRMQYTPGAAVSGGQPPVGKPYQKAEEAVGIISTALAEADVLVRIINPLCKIMPHGHDLHIPPMVTSVLGASDFASELASCELDGFADHNPEEVLGCPMMSASAGFDMLREPCAVVGICGDNNEKNGRQGNHAGGKVHEGVLDDNKAGKAFKKEEYSYPMCLAFGTCDKKSKKSTATTSSTTTASTTTTEATSSTTTPSTTTMELATTEIATVDFTTESTSTTEEATTETTTTTVSTSSPTTTTELAAANESTTPSTTATEMATTTESTTVATTATETSQAATTQAASGDGSAFIGAEAIIGALSNHTR